MASKSLISRQLSRMDQTYGSTEFRIDVSDQMFHVTIPLELCRMQWSIEIYGTDDNSIGFNLSNMSPQSLRTDYKVVVKNQSSTGDDYIWSDPDGVIIFSPVGTVNNTWGTDDLITYKKLHTITGLCVKNTIVLKIEITTFSTVDEMNEIRRHDLTLPEDLPIQKLAHGTEGFHRKERRMQDNLITNRLITKSLSHSSSSGIDFKDGYDSP